jgi:hypothetical protein
MKTAIRAELPNQLVEEAKIFVECGGAVDLNELLTEALRRYLESHSEDLAERFVREDVIWGLRGAE